MPTQTKDGKKIIRAKTPKEWRTWLEKNHATGKTVWLVIRNKTSNKPGISYEQAVEEALCFGWIDSTANKHDDESYLLTMARRKPKGNWSGINKARINRLIKENRMQPAGHAAIDIAKKNGTWAASETIENAVIPADLQKLFDKNKKAFAHFMAFPPSSKRLILTWIHSAKRPETRKKRLDETVKLASKNVRANH